MAQTIENIVDPNDSSLTSEMVSFPGQAGTVNAYVARPKSGTNLGTVHRDSRKPGTRGSYQRRGAAVR